MVNIPEKLKQGLSLPRSSSLPASGASKLSDVLVQNIYEGLIVMDKEHKVVFANTAAHLLLGYHDGELMGLPCGEVLDEEICSLTDWSAGRSHRYTTTLDHGENGILANVTLNTIVLEDHPYRFISIAALPHMHELNESLVRAQRLAGIGTLTTSIAHELNNPISVITNTCVNLNEVLQADHKAKAAAAKANKSPLTSKENKENLEERPVAQDGQIDETAEFRDEVRHYVRMIQRSAWRAVHMIDAIRTYAHNEKVREKSSLNEVVYSALTLAADHLKRRGNVKVETDLANELSLVKCDPNQIAQVLINLLMNAADAMSETGGHIEVKTWDVPELDSVALYIKDSGHGIEDEQLDTIFEPFYTTKPRGEGTGLGLFVAAEIVQQHNGWLRAQNHLNDEMKVAGAQFTVMLPKASR